MRQILEQLDEPLIYMVHQGYSEQQMETYEKMSKYVFGAVVALTVGPLAIATSQVVHAQGFGASDIVSGSVTYTTEDIENGKNAYNANIREVPVISGSMEPVYKVGDVLALNNSVQFEDIKVGDVIGVAAAIRNATYPEIVEADFNATGLIHRVVEITIFEDGSRRIELAGDNNNGDQIELQDTHVNKERYLGKIEGLVSEVAQ
jgi:signal peptidase I